jgi:hypothetical protein
MSPLIGSWSLVKASLVRAILASILAFVSGLGVMAQPTSETMHMSANTIPIGGAPAIDGPIEDEIVPASESAVMEKQLKGAGNNR